MTKSTTLDKTKLLVPQTLMNVFRKSSPTASPVPGFTTGKTNKETYTQCLHTQCNKPHCSLKFQFTVILSFTNGKKIAFPHNLFSAVIGSELILYGWNCNQQSWRNWWIQFVYLTKLKTSQINHSICSLLSNINGFFSDKFWRWIVRNSQSWGYFMIINSSRSIIQWPITAPPLPLSSYLSGYYQI